MPVLDDRADAVRALLAGRAAEERLFARIPSHLDIHACRRRFAQATYRAVSDGKDLPPAAGRLRTVSIDQAAVRQVSRALGHSRRDVTTTHYLR